MSFKDYFSDDYQNHEPANRINNILHMGKVTNLTLFRMYIKEYLLAHPKVHSDKFKLMIRHLQPTVEGLPLEIYCFSTETSLLHFEAVQAEIFEHILAIAGDLTRILSKPAAVM